MDIPTTITHSPFMISQEDGPCVLHKVHSPVTVVNELHHVFPQEWQNAIWGEVRDKERWPVCSTGHNTVHAGLRVHEKDGVWPTWCVGATRDLCEEALRRRDAAIAALG